MKTAFFLFVFISIAAKISAQTVVVTDDNTYVAGQASSVLDVKSTSKGFLAPRMTTAQRIAITSPAEGLLVYQTDGIRGFYFYTNSAWTILAAGTGSQWTSTANNIYYSTGNVGIGLTSPVYPLGVKDTLEIRRTGTISELLFTNTAGSGDLRIAGDGGDIFWQGGGGRNLQMGAYWGIILSGDRQTTVFPALSSGVANTNVLALAQRDASVPLAVQANSATQSANLMEWRSSAATLDVVDKNGNLGLGVTAPSSKLHVAGTNPLTLNGVQTGLVSDSLLTIASGIVRKLPFSTVTSGSSWSLTGNAGTTAGSNFIGTTDNTSLKFRTNGIQGMVLDSLGNAGIGTAPAFTAGTFQEKLLVDAGTTGSYNAIVARGAINNYFQLNIQNESAGVNASADIVATSDNGNESINYIDMGINSSTNTQNIMGAANDAYLYTTGNNLLIGTGTAAKSLVFMTGGTTQSTNERMRIDGNGRVGIGTATPGTALHVVGTNPLTLNGVQTGVVSDSLLTIASGIVRKLPFSSISSGAWSLTGNAGTTAGSNFIGTTDNKSLKFRTNSVQGMVLDSLGNAGIGTAPAFTAGTFQEKLLVDAGTTGSYNAIVARGAINNYFQLNIQNESAGVNASADIVATADNGNESINYIDMGINSSTNTQNIMGAANDAYLYTTGNNLLIGTGTAAKSLVFMTGGTTQSANERMRIDGTGNVGIGNIAPAQRLDITGNLKLSGAFMPGGNAGNSGEFLTSGGSGAAPTWLNANSFIGLVAWLRAGNSGTTSATDFIGTTDLKSLKFKTNNTQRLIADSSGNIGIGTNPVFTTGTFQEKLLVDAGTTGSYNAIVARGAINNYFQLNIQNESAGVNASADIVATADNGTESINYIDMGINSSTNTQNIMGAANDAYLYTTGNNLLIGTATAAQSLVFMTGGTTQSANERMRIDGNGNVGVGITGPTAILHLKAGTATAGTAPLKLNPGVNLTTAENGAVEYDGTNYFATAGGVRYTLAKTLTATASLNFPSTAASAFSNLTITVTGAADGDVVQVGVPNAVAAAGSLYTAYVSAVNTVTVRFFNYSAAAIDPAAATFRVSIIKY